MTEVHKPLKPQLKMLQLICINSLIISMRGSAGALQVCVGAKELWEWRERERERQRDSISTSLFDVINQKA